MKIVALLSCYREGPLAQGAIRSALRVGADAVYVYEGPAGQEAEGPETNWGGIAVPASMVVTRGSWKTDAAKRTAMIEATRVFRPEPTWGVWIDGDEILVNAEYLRDWCQMWTWQDEADREADPDAAPRMGWPIRLVEMDGTVSLARGKVVRVDLIDSYSVSSSVFKDALGQTRGEGNSIERFSDWYLPRAPYMLGAVQHPPIPTDRLHEAVPAELDRMFMLPPLPCEPFIFHRSAMRHPKRRGTRMHEQESSELRRAGIVS